MHCGDLCAFWGPGRMHWGLYTCGNLCAFWVPGRTHWGLCAVSGDLCAFLGPKIALGLYAVWRPACGPGSTHWGLCECGDLCVFWGPGRTHCPTALGNPQQARSENPPPALHVPQRAQCVLAHHSTYEHVTLWNETMNRSMQTTQTSTQPPPTHVDLTLRS